MAELASLVGRSESYLVENLEDRFFMSLLIYYLYFDKVQGDFVAASHSAKHKLQLDLLTHNFTASIFYFRAFRPTDI